MENAKPIFLVGLDCEKNCQAGFRKDFTLDTMPRNIKLRVTGRTFYRVFLNGEFIFHGPARSAHNFTRIDTMDITNKVINGLNKLAIEVAGYNEKNGYITGESSFLLAEAEADGEIILATDDTWVGIRFKQRRQCAEFYSHARCTNELYDLDGIYFGWRINPIGFLPLVPVEELNLNIGFLDRGVSQPDFSIANTARLLTVSGIVRVENKQVSVFSAFETEEYLDYLDREHIERPSVECVQEKDTGFDGEIEYFKQKLGMDGLRIKATGQATAVDFDFGELSSAFLGIEFSCSSDTTIDLVHAEKINTDGAIDPRGSFSNSVVRLHCKAGQFRFETFEPYCIRYLRAIIRGADEFQLHEIFLRRYQYPVLNEGSFLCSDGELNRIYEASKLTLRLNTLDVFMDCPGRERSGWLCDSFWSARAARMLFNDTSVDRAMLENYLYVPDEASLQGFFPACYPIAKLDNFIPNWAMFLVLQLHEYYHRTNDKALIETYSNRIDSFIGKLQEYENKDRLLENLPGYVFLDWSISNAPEFKEPISVPTNALYAKVLECSSELYNKPEWKTKADAIREKLKNNAYNNDFTPGAMPGFFSDSLHYDRQGKLAYGKFSSEAAQYYCMWLDVATKEDFPSLIEKLIEEFGPYPKRYPSNLAVGRANVFIGLYMRFELLSKWNKHDRLLGEMRRLFSYMIDNGPGTLWENLSDFASMCHGFASHAGVWLVRDYLGIGIPDAVEKKITISPHPCGLKWAKGSIMTENGVLTLNWALNESKFIVTANIPKGYLADIKIPEEVCPWRYITINGIKALMDKKELTDLSGAVDLIVEK